MTSDPATDKAPFEQFIEPDSLPVFVERADDLAFRIVPRFDRGRLRWAVRVSEGPRVLVEDVTGLSEDAAERIGVDVETLERLNDDRQFIHRKFPSLPVQGNRELIEYPLAAVETIAESW